MSGVTQWRDCTSYSRGDKERVPTSYEIKHGWLRICITCGHIYHRPKWVLHCGALGIDSKRITVLDNYQFTADDDLDTVKARAIEIVDNRIDEIRSDIIVIKREALK